MSFKYPLQGQLTEQQKKQLIGVAAGALMVLAVQVLAIFGVDVQQRVTVPPTPVLPDGYISAPSTEVNGLTAGLNGYNCGPGTGACLRSFYGRDIAVYSDAGATSKFSVDGATGSVQLAGGLAPVGASTTVTNSQQITPTASMNLITATVPATITLGAPSINALFALENVSAQTITLVDTGTTVLGGNWAAGQYDTIWLWYDGSRWVELARSNN